MITNNGRLYFNIRVYIGRLIPPYRSHCLVFFSYLKSMHNDQLQENNMLRELRKGLYDDGKEWIMMMMDWWMVYILVLDGIVQFHDMLMRTDRVVGENCYWWIVIVNSVTIAFFCMSNWNTNSNFSCTGSREAAFLYAISSAGVTFAITQVKKIARFYRFNDCHILTISSGYTDYLILFILFYVGMCERKYLILWMCSTHNNFNFGRYCFPLFERRGLGGCLRMEMGWVFCWCRFCGEIVQKIFGWTWNWGRWSFLNESS